MTLADKVTSLRLFLAPVFFAVYLLPLKSSFWPLLAVIILWVLFVISEITDLVDGKIARSRNEVSDFGKLFDPFADTLVRISYFLCFVVDKILPAALFLVILYREFGILFIRIMMMKKGVAMGARKGGKLKAVAYMITGVLALFASTLRRLGADPALFSLFTIISVGFFGLSVLFSVISFIDYFLVCKRAR